MRSSSMRFTSHSPLLMRAGEAGCPISTSGTFRPVTSAGKPSCDGSTSEFRIIDLITQHDVTADEKFSGGCRLGLRSTATLHQALIETLQVVVIFDGRMSGFYQQVAQHPRAGFADPQK